METDPVALFQYETRNTPAPVLAFPAAPKAVSLELRKAIRIRRFRRGDALELARKSRRVLIERGGILTEGIKSFDPQQALAAYVDRRRLKGRHSAEVGMECFLHSLSIDDGEGFLVEAKADGDKGTFTVQVEVAEYRQARERLLAVIEAAGKWLDACWFDRVIRESSALHAKTKLFSSDKTGDKPRTRRKMTAQEKLSIWVAFRRTLLAMCRQRDNRDLSFAADETAVIIELPKRAAKMQLSFQQAGIVKVAAGKRERIPMVITRRRGFAFDLRGTLFSGTHLAIELLHELRALRVKRRRGHEVSLEKP